MIVIYRKVSIYPTGVSGKKCFLKYQTRDKKYLEFYFLPTRVFSHFEGKFSMRKLSVSIFGQTTGSMIYTVSREPIRLPEIQNPVFGI